MSRIILCLAFAASAAPPPVVTVVSPRGERRVPVSLERGYPALALAQLGAVLSVEAVPAPAGAAAVRVLGRQVDFVLDAGYFRFDDRVYTLAAGPYLARDTLFVPLQWVVEYLPRLFEGRFRFDAARSRLEELPPPEKRPVVSASAPAAGKATGRERERPARTRAGHRRAAPPPRRRGGPGTRRRGRRHDGTHRAQRVSA